MIRIPHLETDVTQACQLSCVACNHSVPLWRKLGPWQADPKQVERDLGHLARLLHADRWGALGGEPLLYRRLLDVLKIARDSNVADKIEVWTNGLLIQKQPDEFWRLTDILVLSIYEGKLSEAQLAWIRGQCADTGVELALKDERNSPNFRSMLEVIDSGPQATYAKFHNCFFRSFSRAANYGYFFTCCCAPQLPMLMQGREYGADGVKIEGLTSTALEAYLFRSEPLGCCKICAGRDTAVPIQWSEERDPQRWLQKSRGL